MTELKDYENKSLCMTCGEYKHNEKFDVGDCTCHDCYEAGNGQVNYEIRDGEVVER